MELAKLRASQSKDSLGSGGSGGSSFGSSTNQGFQDTMSVSQTPDTGMSNMTTGMSMSMSMVDDTGPAPLKPKAPTKGMALGKKKPGDVFAGLGMTDPAPVEASKEEAIQEPVA